MKRTLQPAVIGLAPGFLEAMGEDRRPGVHRWIHIAEVPLVRGNLSARMQVTLSQHEIELLLAEFRIDERQREYVKGEIPCRIPRVFPLVRHRDDVGIQHVAPARVARRPVPIGCERIGAAFGQPHVDVVVVVLLRPHHARERLPHHPLVIVIERAGDDRRVELLGLVQTLLEDSSTSNAERVVVLRRRVREPQPNVSEPRAGTVST